MPREDYDSLSPTPGRGMGFAQFARNVIRQVMIDLRVGCPATVVSWTPPQPGVAPATVLVQPAFMFSLVIDTPAELPPGFTLMESGGVLLAQRALPQIPGVPVIYPAVSSGCMLRGPLQPGDDGWLHFSDRSLDSYKSLGGNGLCDPVVTKFHHLGDCVFVPGLRHGLTAQPIDATKFTLGPESDAAGLDFEIGTNSVALRTIGPEATIDATGFVNVGDAATSAIAKADALVTAIDAMLAALVAAGAGAGYTGAGSAQAAWNAAKAAIAATKGRVV